MDMKRTLLKVIQKEQNAQISYHLWLRRLAFSLIALCACSILAVSSTFAQKRQFILYDSLDSNFQTNKYTLQANSLYGQANLVELYNIYLRRDVLVLFSVLPDFERGDAWEKIDELDTPFLTGDQFYSDMWDRVRNHASQNKFMDKYALVKKDGDTYYASKNTLVEIFNIRHYSSDFNTPNGVINTGQNPISIRQMAAIYETQFPDRGFPLDLLNGPAIMWDRDLLARMYLSDTLKIQGERAFKFWTFTDWNVSDGMNVQRGIDRFIYLPGKGIVGGSYDFYFDFRAKLDFTPMENRYTISRDQWMQNILDEKVMLAEELK